SHKKHDHDLLNLNTATSLFRSSASVARSFALCVISSIALDDCCVEADVCSTPAAASSDTEAISLIKAFICSLPIAISDRCSATCVTPLTIDETAESIVSNLSPVFSIC